MINDDALAQVLGILREAYPNPKPELLYTTPYELLVATILSAQTTDRQVNLCTRALFPVHNTPQAIAELDEDDIFPYIKTCGLYKTKGKNLIAASKLLVSEYGGEVPRSREELMSLPGVGRKTANVVLSNAFNIPAIAVDTHVFRVSNRIGITHARDELKTELSLMERIPQSDWGDAHHWIIFHGRRVCAAKKPNCVGCCISAVCERNNLG